MFRTQYHHPLVIADRVFPLLIIGIIDNHAELSAGGADAKELINESGDASAIFRYRIEKFVKSGGNVLYFLCLVKKPQGTYLPNFFFMITSYLILCKVQLAKPLVHTIFHTVPYLRDPLFTV